MSRKSPAAAAEPFPLCDHADQLVEAFRQVLPGALGGEDVEAIHQARVATRRIKAATDLFKRVIPKQPRKGFVRTLRRVRRSLGRVRDIDVMLGHLDALAAAGASEHRQAIDWLNVKLHARRDRRV